MLGINEYKDWCNKKGLKPSNAKALNQYYSEKKLSRIYFIKFKMKLNNDTLESLGDYLGITRQTVAKKINNETDFTLKELNLLKAKWNLTDEEFMNLCTKEITKNEYTTSGEAVK